MSLYKTNLGALDKQVPVEVLLMLESFAGGENTLGSDAELTLNEARLMENWDVNSIGSMIRSAGFSLAASGANYIGDTTFDGTGPDDLTPSGVYPYSEYVQASGTSSYNVEITGVTDAAVADTFKYSRDDVVKASGIAIPLEALPSGYEIEDGVYLKWESASGHTTGDNWDFDAYSFTDSVDFVIQHSASGSIETYAVVEGSLLVKDEYDFTVEDKDVFTDGILCHGVSINNQLWITNATDNLKNKVMNGSITTPSSVPTNAGARIYYFKSRLISEGSGRTVYGSRVQPGYWSASDAWSLVNDSWSITMPNDTNGMAVGFPSGDDVMLFTEKQAFALFNMPNIAQKPITGSHGCSAPYSIAVGEEGVYFVSRFPSLGVFLYNGATWTNLSEKQEFPDDINFSYRIFGIYKDRKYYLLYSSSATGIAYPNTIKVYDAQFGRWYTRSLNTDLGEALGYPTILNYTDKSLYIGSSATPKVYDFDNTDYTSDNGLDTIATYKTKNFTSRDFSAGIGGQIPIDEVRIKLIKMLMIAYGADGVITLNWVADRGKYSGSQTVPFSAEGDIINTTFIVNTSLMHSGSEDKTDLRSFANKAIGRRFNFEINDRGTTTRREVKKLKIHGNLIEEA